MRLDTLEISGQPAREVDATLRRSLDDLGRAHHAAAFCFAEILSRRLYRELGYSSIHQYAAAALGFSPGRTAQFLRLAEALNRLPLLREAVIAGRLSWSKAVVIAAIATPRSEAVWLAEAQRLSRPDLVRLAAAARARIREEATAQTLVLSAQPMILPPCPPRPAPPPATEPPPGRAPRETAAAAPFAPLTPNAGAAAVAAAAIASPRAASVPTEVPLTVTLRFTPAQYARYATLMERLRRQVSLGRRDLPAIAGREGLLLAALDALLAAGAGPTPERGAAAPPYQIVLYRCQECGGTEVKTPFGARPLPLTAGGAALCDARIFAPGGRNEATIPPAVRRTVLARDEHSCRAPGCGRTRFLEIHHRVPRARGGTNAPDNLVTLCSACHQLRHERAAAAGP